MATKLNQDRVEAIAYEYCRNGFIKSLALQSVGYTIGYAKHDGLKIYDKHNVKAAIEAEMAKKRAKVEYNREQAEVQVQQHIDIALNKEVPDIAAANSALSIKCKLFGLLIDKKDVNHSFAGYKPPEQADYKALSIAKRKAVSSVEVDTEPQEGK